MKTKLEVLILIILSFYICLNVASAELMINFTEQTPNISTTNNSIYINTSITSVNDTYAFINWENSLVGWWRMDEVDGSGNPTDISGNGHNATLFGNSGQTDGKFNKSIEINGTSGAYFRSNPTPEIDNANAEITMAGWFNFKSITAPSVQAIFTKLTGTSETSLGFTSYMAGSGKITFKFGNGTLFSSATTTSPVLSAGIWQHIAIVMYSNGTAYVYVNGTKVLTESSMAIGLAPATNQNLTIGAYSYSGTLNLNASVDEVVLFNRTLDESEIFSLYNSTANRLERNFADLEPTNHTFQAFTVDTEGNKNQTESRTVLSSIIAPAITINSPSEGQAYFASSVDLNLTIDKDGTCNYSLDEESEAYVMSTTDNRTFNTTLTSLSDGEHTANFSCYNSIGVINDSENVSFWIATNSATTNLVFGSNLLVWDAPITNNSLFLPLGATWDILNMTATNTEDGLNLYVLGNPDNDTWGYSLAGAIALRDVFLANPPTTYNSTLKVNMSYESPVNSWLTFNGGDFFFNIKKTSSSSNYSYLIYQNRTSGTGESPPRDIQWTELGNIYNEYTFNSDAENYEYLIDDGTNSYKETWYNYYKEFTLDNLGSPSKLSFNFNNISQNLTIHSITIEKPRNLITVLPGRTMSIGFDWVAGYENHWYTNSFPIFQEFNGKATLYIDPGYEWGESQWALAEDLINNYNWSAGYHSTDKLDGFDAGTSDYENWTQEVDSQVAEIYGNLSVYPFAWTALGNVVNITQIEYANENYGMFERSAKYAGGPELYALFEYTDEAMTDFINNSETLSFYTHKICTPGNFTTGSCVDTHDLTNNTFYKYMEIANNRGMIITSAKDQFYRLRNQKDANFTNINFTTEKYTFNVTTNGYPAYLNVYDLNNFSTNYSIVFSKDNNGNINQFDHSTPHATNTSFEFWSNNNTEYNIYRININGTSNVNVSITEYNSTQITLKENVTENTNITHTVRNLEPTTNYSINLDGSTVKTESSDSSGILNFSIELNSSHTLIIANDQVSPIITFKCSSDSLNIGETITCSCSATDNLDLNPKTTYNDNLITGSTTGTFITTCTFTDGTGNSATKSISYTVNQAIKRSNLNIYTIIHSEKNLFQKEPITEVLNIKQKIEFKIKNAIHFISATKIINKKSAKIRIESKPIEEIFNIGDEKNYDLDSDGIYDLFVKLNSIENNKVNITIKSTNEEITQDKNKTEVIETPTSVENKETEEEPNFFYVKILIISGILVVAVIIFMLKRKKIHHSNHRRYLR